ncbi:MAG TPA: hypothetical protein VHF27_14215 [Acidimicrobiales bacterium]|nr:hypothetical protein [Acidimicrobiales bacterium]
MAARLTTAAEADLLSRRELRRLAEVGEGPCVSILLRTHRAGRETEQDRIRLKNHLSEAEHLMSAWPGRESMLAPAHDLVDDRVFWRYQADGLALFIAPGLFRVYRLPLPLPEKVLVADAFHLVPLLPLLTGDATFFILALSQKSVRLFEATRFTIVELDPPDLPRSMAEALAHEDREKQLQVRSAPTLGGGGGPALFHGHGGGDEEKKEALERYFRAVDRSVVRALGDEQRPLVLAAVDYYLPIYRAVTAYRPVVDDAVSGNPVAWPVKELHARAWALVEPGFSQTRERALSLFRSLHGTGLTVSTVGEIAAAARQGRIDLLLATTGAGDGTGDDDTEMINAAALQTLLTGGNVYVVEPDMMPESLPAAALLRY